MIPEFMFRFPIIDGSSLVDSGLFDLLTVVAAGCVFACSVVLDAGVCDVWVGVVCPEVVCPEVVVVVWATAASELPSNEAVKTSAVTMREKLFILKNLQKAQ
jgi:hypothetical protein